MGEPRETYRYQYKMGNKISHVGITNDLARREAEHQQEHPGGHIVQQGPRVTRESAERWEREQAERGRPTEGHR